MADKLFLSLVTPEKEMVIDPDVDQVNIPGSEGDLGILADHAPLHRREIPVVLVSTPSSYIPLTTSSAMRRRCWAGGRCG